MKHMLRLMIATLLLGGVVGQAEAAHENAKRDANRVTTMLGVTAAGEIRMVQVGNEGRIELSSLSSILGTTLFDASAAGGQTQFLLPPGTNYFSVRAAAVTTTQTGFLNYNDEPSSNGTGTFFNAVRGEIKRKDLLVGTTGTTLNISSGGPDTIPVSVDWGRAD